jgi:hypothetical protein
MMKIEWAYCKVFENEEDIGWMSYDLIKYSFMVKEDVAYLS